MSSPRLTNQSSARQTGSESVPSFDNSEVDIMSNDFDDDDDDIDFVPAEEGSSDDSMDDEDDEDDDSFQGWITSLT